MQAILDEVKARSLEAKGLLDDDAFEAIVDEVTGGGSGNGGSRG
jgi:hypothetical protein